MQTPDLYFKSLTLSSVACPLPVSELVIVGCIHLKWGAQFPQHLNPSLPSRPFPSLPSRPLWGHSQLVHLPCLSPPGTPTHPAFLKPP